MLFDAGAMREQRIELVFCEMMIVYSELDRPLDTIAAVADLLQLAYPVDAARLLAAAAPAAGFRSAPCR